MCGRFHIDISEPEWRDIIYDIMQKHPLDKVKEGEIFPTDKAPVIISGYDRPEAEYFKWGYDKPNGQKGVMINARAETVTEKPMFRNDFYGAALFDPRQRFFRVDGRQAQVYVPQAGRLTVSRRVLPQGKG